MNDQNPGAIDPRVNQKMVHDLVLALITSMQPDPAGSGGGSLEFYSTIDGLTSVIATLAESADVFPTPRDKRLFCENFGKALLKNMREVRAQLDKDPAKLWSVERLGGLN